MRVGRSSSSPTVQPSSGTKSPIFSPACSKTTSHQTVAVRVDAGAGQAENDVADLDALAVDDAIAFDDADAEPGHVVVARLVEVGQNRRLAADQRTLRIHAAVADALDQLADQGRIVLGQGDVVEKEQRFAAGAQAIVNGHGHEIDANRVVLVHQPGDLELGTDAVGAGNEHGPAIVLGEQPAVVVEAEETGKAAEAVEERGVCVRRRNGTMAVRLCS